MRGRCLLCWYWGKVRRATLLGSSGAIRNLWALWPTVSIFVAVKLVSRCYVEGIYLGCLFGTKDQFGAVPRGGCSGSGRMPRATTPQRRDPRAYDRNTFIISCVITFLEAWMQQKDICSKGGTEWLYMINVVRGNKFCAPLCQERLIPTCKNL